jgi:hypothetical protein
MTVAKLTQAREQLNAARKTLVEEARGTIEETLIPIFQHNPDIDVVTWAQKSSEYDDEGMYPGIHGPIGLTEEEAENEDRFPDWLYGYTEKKDDRLSSLTKVLTTIGDEVLSEIYGDQNVVTAQRANDKVCESCKQPIKGNGFLITNEFAGY